MTNCIIFKTMTNCGAASTSSAPPQQNGLRPPSVQPHRNPFAPPPPLPSPDDYDDAINCSPCCDDPNVSRTFKALILGQILSLCLCGTGVSSQLLVNENVNAPAAQAFSNYFLLCFVYCISLACKTDDNSLVVVLRKRGWRYLILAIIDVEANYMIVKAYQYTNLTSVQLLDCATIPTVLFLSWLFLSVRYLASHILGVTICLVGIACVIWADALGDKGAEGGSNKVLGDVLCLAAAVMYAICNVAEEFLVKQHSRTEYLGMLGLFGCIVSGVQTAVFEQEALSKIVWDGTTVSYFALFAFSMFIFYSLVTVVLQKTSALMFNLSTLTADFYSLLFGIFMFKDTFHYLYFVSFIICIIGSVIYSMRETQVSDIMQTRSNRNLQMRDADEPRRVCPCLFVCCCCCGCCFEEGDSTEGSIDVSPSPNERMQMGLNPRSSISPCPVHGNQLSHL
ncbi:Protein CBG22265 [Caenorhabditis briggsae]|uniref:Protein CBG22265 n=1 Tax=Caenorhabditis briggsae TaxID=6238 RepID=A8Y1X6_CAEBR|nr:Protein CBG22265 [Caenorhabditis briggsae]CAP38896.2 Protein CBG22265 [Caenorhabditis briggsae]